MQSQKLAFGDFLESRMIRRLDVLRGPSGDVSGCVLLAHAAAHDLSNERAKFGAVTEPEGIGIAQRLPHRAVTACRSLVGPDEYVLEKIDLVQLVNSKH